jgi:hypothetical protein
MYILYPYVGEIPFSLPENGVSKNMFSKFIIFQIKAFLELEENIKTGPPKLSHLAKPMAKTIVSCQHSSDPGRSPVKSPTVSDSFWGKPGLVLTYQKLMGKPPCYENGKLTKFRLGHFQ